MSRTCLEVEPPLKPSERAFLGFGACGISVFLGIAVWQFTLLVRAIGQQT